MTAATLKLRYFGSAVLFAVLIAISAVAWRFGLNAIAGFWTAYVLTRPLGASIVDWFGRPAKPHGGLRYGDGTVTIVATVAIVALVAYVAITRSDIQPEPAADNELASAYPGTR